MQQMIELMTKTMTKTTKDNEQEW